MTKHSAKANGERQGMLLHLRKQGCCLRIIPIILWFRSGGADQRVPARPPRVATSRELTDRTLIAPSRVGCHLKCLRDAREGNGLSRSGLSPPNVLVVDP